jgi:hypothetical protein
MIHQLFEGIGDMYEKEFEMAAIWLEKPLQTATEKTIRITDGHLVKVEGGKLIDCVDCAPTHKVIGCFGTVTSSSLSFILLDLQTNQPLNLKIK